MIAYIACLLKNFLVSLTQNLLKVAILDYQARERYFTVNGPISTRPNYFDAIKLLLAHESQLMGYRCLIEKAHQANTEGKETSPVVGRTDHGDGTIRFFVVISWDQRLKFFFNDRVTAFLAAAAVAFPPSQLVVL